MSDDDRNDDEDDPGICENDQHKTQRRWLHRNFLFALDELKQDYVDEQTGESGRTLK